MEATVRTNLVSTTIPTPSGPTITLQPAHGWWARLTWASGKRETIPVISWVIHSDTLTVPYFVDALLMAPGPLDDQGAMLMSELRGAEKSPAIELIYGEPAD